MKNFKDYTLKICICLIVLLVTAGLYVECPNFQMVFGIDNQTSPISKIDLSNTDIDATEINAEEVDSLRVATAVAKKMASTMKNRRMERVPACLLIPIVLSEKNPYYFEINQRLAELPTKRSGLLQQYVHEKDGKKRITTT